LGNHGVEQAVTKSARTSDAAARELLEGWLAEWYAPAYRTARLILNNHAEAEDAVQDAFLRLWRFRDSIPEGDSAKAWLYRVVVNACFSRARSEGRARKDRLATPQHALLDDLEERRPGPEEEATDHIEGIAIRRAIAALPESLRVPLVLRYYSGLSEREIAVAIHRRPGTVKSRLHDARHRLEADPELARWLSIEEAT
jgi:RNA polymerase sigma-70 factor (ECF subfamily)